MESKNPIQIAAKVGQSLGGNIGELAFIELELAYVTRLLPRFFDDPVMRVNQNVLLYWQRGYYKSTSLKVFHQTIPESPKTINITSMTLEKIFGSIDEKKRHIIEPAFTNDIAFVSISELTAMLGRGDAMKQFADTMNMVLEGEKVERRILKLGSGEISDEELTRLAKKGVHYDPAEGVISYVPNVCVLAATRPLDNRYFTYLNKGGYLSRHHVVQRRITREEASEHLHRDFKLDQEALSRLKELNLKLAGVKIGRIYRPSEALMKLIYDELEALVDDEITEGRQEFAEVINPRVKGDIIRELVAHAFLRTAHQNVFGIVDELKYAQEDVEFVRNRLDHFIDFVMNPLIAEEFTSTSTKKPKMTRAKEFILKLLSDGELRSGHDIVESTAEENGCREATAYKALRHLRDEGRICEPRYSYYKLKEDCNICGFRGNCAMINSGLASGDASRKI